MKALIRKISLAAAALALSASAYAVNVVVNPVTGLDSVGIDQRFYWGDGLGPIDSIGTPGGGGAAFDPFWEITVGAPSTIDALALDGFIAGDVFELVVNGIITPWTSSFFDLGGFFHGVYDDLALPAGTTLITLNVTAGLSSGGSWMNFSPVTPGGSVPDASSSAALLALGFGSLVAFSRRKSRSA